MRLPPAALSVKTDKPTNLYTESTYFVSFARKNEDWTTTTQVDQQVNSQLTEMGNSDVIDKAVLNVAQHRRSLLPNRGSSINPDRWSRFPKESWMSPSTAITGRWENR